MTLRHYNILGLSASGSDPKNSLPSLPHAHLGANFVDLAGKLQPGNILRITGRRRVVAHPLVHVSAIHAGGSDAYAHSIGVR
jgi:hypothetical protein